ncbi:trace amine-associated receptor 13c-like isoform X2 [Dicentrarchus labrax]|uniref:trace amine-associated receptor 13c-like isoform X2 n=1 Tax=Dicentrarchus labrax TaxID=13489 RepID=UPI0021F61158|nr:trace amine-associated receptor 13c-like isoform X2 [Dicentrarchus labrax]
MEEVELCFPQLLNTSCRRLERPQSEALLINILLFFISVLTAALNLLVIISISHFRKLHSPTNLLLLSLAVSDFFVGLLMFFQILLIDGCWPLGDVVCILYQYVAYIITSASVGNMVLISVDRYVAICTPLHYSLRVTKSRVKACVFLCWSCSVLCQTAMLKDNLVQPGRYHSCSGQCVTIINYIAGIADVILTFIGPVTVIVVLYMRVFVVAASQAHATRSRIAAVRCSVTVTAKKSEMKAARNLGVVVVAFLVCLCPFCFITITGQDTVLDTSSVVFVISLFYFNSCLNPLIYAFLYPWFRKAIRLIVTLQILQPDSCKANVL